MQRARSLFRGRFGAGRALLLFAAAVAFASVTSGCGPNHASSLPAAKSGDAVHRGLRLVGVSQIQSGTAYTIVNQLSLLALEPASMNDGARIQQWSCSGTAHQNWVVASAGGGAYTIVNQLSGKALDDTGASTANGNPMQQWSPNGGQQQSWSITAQGGGAYTVVNQLSGKALDDTGLSLVNGTVMQQYDGNGGQQQNWVFVPAGSCNAGPVQSGSAYTIVNQLSGLALDDTNGSMSNGTRIQQWNCNGNTQQNWVFNYAGLGAYTVVNALSGKAMDDANGSTADGNPIQQWSPNGGQQQRWLPIAQGAMYALVNQLSGMALDDTGLSLANGNLMQQWDRNGGRQQNWQFMPAGTCGVRGFSILIDTNQMELNEANNDAPLAADGVWSLPGNSCSGCVPDPITDPNGTWPGALARLNAANWSVAEDVYNTSYSSSQQTAQYIGHAVNAVMVYHEAPDPNNPPPNDTVLTTSEIDAAAAATGNPIIVLSRSYADQRANYVRAALYDPHCSGVAFEQNPDYGHLSTQNYIQGIQDILASGRKAYMLLPPFLPMHSPPDDYLADMQSGVTQYLANSQQLGNPNLSIVITVYTRPGQGVGFLQPEPGTGAPANNSILAVRNWLYNYRAAQFPGGTR